MAKAIAYLDDVVVADSDNTVIVEGNHYFPKEDVKKDLLKATDMHTTCHWKGDASYFNVEAEGKTFPNAAFEYKDPSEQAIMIKDRVAFWQGIRVEEK